MPRFLIVPVDVAALAVTGAPLPGDTGFMRGMTEFDKIPYVPEGESADGAPFISESVLASPFTGGDTGDPGVSVHWAMPDALMHGTRPVGSDGKPVPGSAPQFPRLPDRWLVTRVALIGGQAPKVRSWVVDSRYLSSTKSAGLCNRDSAAVPWQADEDPDFTGQAHRFLGRAVPLADWPAGSAAPEGMLDRLDATSFGMLELAAYFPNTRNVFGLYDDLADLGHLDQVELCYAVTGWHVDAADDPLAGRSADAAAAKLAELKWSVAQPGAFDATAYAGTVNSVVWQRNQAAARPGAMTATIGNTTAEALASLIVRSAPDAVAQAHDTDDIEFQLHSLLTGQLALHGDPVGRRMLRRQLHQQRFSPAAATLAWYVRNLNDDADVSSTLDPALGAQLDGLNGQQAEADRLQRSLSARQWQLFADWYKYLVATYADPPPGESYPDTNAVMGYLAADHGPVKTVEDTAAALAAARQAAEASRSALLAALANSPLAGQVDLAQKPAQIFYRPADPVLLLSGDDVQPALRYGGDHRFSADGTLVCRGSDALVSALAAPAGAVGGAPALRLAASGGPGLGAPLSGHGLETGPATAASALVAEAALLWPGWAAAALSAQPGGGGQGALAGWRSWVKDRADAFLGAAAAEPGTPVYQGAAPSLVGIELWSGNPWLPVSMHWDIAYWPAQMIDRDAGPAQELAPALITSRLHADDDSLDSTGVDLKLEGDFPRRWDYQGITFITPHAGYAAWKQLRDYAASVDDADPALEELARQVKPMPLLSQALSGFHERFLLRKRTLQFAVRDPFAQGSEWDVIARLRNALALGAGDATLTAPMPLDAFAPVRAGQLALSRLRLVDAFGQYREYEFGADQNHRLQPAQPLSPAQMFADPTTAPAFVPPRISQPAALHVQWLSAAADAVTTGTRPATSPICGWIVPNYLDDSLMIYSADGAALGSVARVGGALAWLGSPTRADRFADSAAETFAAANGHLRDFVTALLARADGPGYLVRFMNALNDACATIQPLNHAPSAQVSVLAGQPLALVRAQLTLELAADPAINNTWAAFTHDMAAGTAARTTNRHEAVNFPVLLGSGDDDPDDGLVGFYLDAEARPFDTFYAAVASDHADIPTRAIRTITVSVDGAPVAVTMLIDPRCPVHATTGYMPLQSLQLPAGMFRDAYDRLRVTFLTAPVLTPAAAAGAVPLLLPMPGQQKGGWWWVNVTADGQGRKPVLSDVAALAPDQPLAHDTCRLQDGWLLLDPGKDPKDPTPPAG